MKVIKKGKLWSKQVTCTGNGNGNGGCESILEVEKTDIYTTSSQCYGDDYPTTHYTIKCPECGVETDISGLPQSVTKGLVKKETFFRSRNNNNSTFEDPNEK